MNALLLWDNNNNSTEQLCKYLGISFPDDVCFTLEELKNKTFLQGRDAVIVLLETNIDSKIRTNFCGLEIIKLLRKELRYRGMIIAYSFCDENFFRENKNAKILFTSGIWLKSITKINVDEIDKQIDSFTNKKLSDDLLDDIHYSVFDNKGKIHELLHNLKNRLNIKGKILKDIRKQAEEIFEEYKKPLLKEIDPFKTKEFDKFYTTLIKETIVDINTYWDNEKDKNVFSYGNGGNQVNKFDYHIIELAPVSNGDANTQQAEKINWQVLFLDDNEDVREKVKAFFDEKKVTCHTAKTEDDVHQKLKENRPNISLFISDIRLLDKSEHWCDRQGYDVIEQVNKQNDYPLVYAVLTSKKGTINKMVQKKRKYQILWFTKEDVINNKNSFNIFFDLIKEYADNNFKANSDFKIQSTAWNNPTIRGTGTKNEKITYRFPLKDYYKSHYESEDHDAAEVEINYQVKKILTGKAQELIKLRTTLNSKVIDKYELNKFRKIVLLGRRLFLGYIFTEKKIDFEEIYKKVYKPSTYNFKTAKSYVSDFCLSHKLDTLYDNIIEYYNADYSNKKSIPLLYEEYEFIEKEFLDIVSSNEYELNETELNLLKQLFNIFSEIFRDESDIDDIPLSIKKVNILLSGKHFVLPCVQLLFDVADEVKNVKAISKSAKIYKLDFTLILNSVFIEFLKKCDLM